MYTRNILCKLLLLECSNTFLFWKFNFFLSFSHIITQIKIFLIMLMKKQPLSPVWFSSLLQFLWQYLILVLHFASNSEKKIPDNKDDVVHSIPLSFLFLFSFVLRQWNSQSFFLLTKLLFTVILNFY